MSFEDGIKTLTLGEAVYSSNEKYGRQVDSIIDREIPEWMTKPEENIGCLHESGRRIVEEGFIQVASKKECPDCKVEVPEIVVCYHRPSDNTWWAYYKIIDDRFFGAIATMEEINLKQKVRDTYEIPHLLEYVFLDVFHVPYEDFIVLDYPSGKYRRYMLTAAELKTLNEYNGMYKTYVDDIRNADKKAREEGYTYTADTYPDTTIEHPFKLVICGTGADDSYSKTYESLEDLRKHLYRISEKPLTRKTVVDEFIFTN